MSARRVYLGKHRRATSQRAHFAIFIPDETSDRATLAQDFRQISTVGTVIHVTGEPVMNGYAHEFKRNYGATTSDELSHFVFLGTVDVATLFEPPPSHMVRESTPRGRLEREATMVSPPRGGQDVRAPVDGVNTKRCQEWTMEFLRRLVSQRLIDDQAVERAQAERDPPNHGIFGAGRAAS